MSTVIQSGSESEVKVNNLSDLKRLIDVEIKNESLSKKMRENTTIPIVLGSSSDLCGNSEGGEKMENEAEKETEAIAKQVDRLFDNESLEEKVEKVLREMDLEIASIHQDFKPPSQTTKESQQEYQLLQTPTFSISHLVFIYVPHRGCAVCFHFSHSHVGSHSFAFRLHQYH